MRVPAFHVKLRSSATLFHRLTSVVAIAVMLTVAAVSMRRAEAQEVPELQINSTNYIVLDADTGEIYAQRGAHERSAMASITKIFTAIEAIERGSLDQEITTRPADLYDENSSLMGFGPGETFTLEELLYGMMLPSGNDAAHAIARSLGDEPGLNDEESYERFVGWMNERVRNMGLADTHFVNPHGWGVPGHYSTVYDIAAFTRYALQYPTFVDLISTASYTTSNGHELYNNNRLLSMYPDLVGGKTGYDWDAGWCLVEVAKRGDTTMISVTFDGIAPDDWYDDNMVLLDYAFETKAKREAQGLAFSGEVATFLDPDAAVLAGTAQSGGSLPRFTALPLRTDDDSQPTESNSLGPVESSTQTDSGVVLSTSSETARWAFAVAIAILLIGGRAMIGIIGQPMPRTIGTRLVSGRASDDEPKSASTISP
jgi:D-alanyl-D-alanine carboxypeptidase (penicillin-binding protein 5/6)